VIILGFVSSEKHHLFSFPVSGGAIFFEIISVNLTTDMQLKLPTILGGVKKMKMNLALLVMVFVMVSWVAGLGVAHSQKESALSGKVVETMDSGGYTYVLLDNDGKQTWVAVTKMKVVK